MEIYLEIINNSTKIKTKCILEIGSRDGHDANKLKNLFGVEDKNVWVVEPNPNQCELITEIYPNFNLVDCAISNINDFVDFNQLTGDEMVVGTSSILDRADSWYHQMGAKKIKVKSITGKKLLEKINFDVDVCKIDVEGLTYQVLESFGKEIYKIKSFHLECEHREVWRGQKLYDEVETFLINNKYIRVYSDYFDGKLQSDTIWVHEDYIK